MDYFLIIAIFMAILTVLLLTRKRVIKDSFETKEMQVEIDFGKQKVKRSFLQGDYVGKIIEVTKGKEKKTGIITKIYFEGIDEEEEFEKRYKKWL